MEKQTDPAEWVQANFWIPELRGPIVLGAYQVKCLREALSRDEKGDFKYSIVLWSDIKKSAKSSVAAAVDTWFCDNFDYVESYIVANDLKQANSRVAEYFRRALTLNPNYRNKYKNRGYRTTFNNHSFAEAIPIDPSGEAGSNADLIITSELWGAHEEAQQQMWAEMTLSPTKFGRSMRWVESYAGYTGQSELLWSLYQLGVKEGELLWPEPMETNFDGPQPLEAYVNRRARMFCLWNTFPRLPWQTQAYYESERAVLTEAQFNRLHRNQWSSPQETFIPAEWWNACKDPNMPGLEFTKGGLPRTPVVMALDAGVSSDNFGLLLDSRHPTITEETCVRYAQRWVPPPGGKIDFVGTKEHPGPEMVIEELCKKYNVVEIAYDPSQLEDMAGRLRRKGIAWFKPFGQAEKRAVADSALRNRIRDRRIHHDGNPELAEHIQNADAKKDPTGEHSIRLVKRAEKLKIDLAVCLSMADYETMRLNL